MARAILSAIGSEEGGSTATVTQTKLGDKRGILTGAEARVARDDPEQPTALGADPGE
jgi:hypothetical protein